MKNLTDFYQKNKDGALFFINFATDKTLKIAGYGILKVLLLIFFMGIFVSANAQLQNYDLAFGAFDDCKESQVDVKITGMDNPEWTVDYLHVYIKYTVVGATGQDDFNIDETKTRISLASNLKVFYEGYNGGFMVNFYESPNGQTGRISIEAKIKNGETRKKFETMQDLITIFFNKPNQSSVSSVKFEFLYDSPYNSRTNLYDKEDVAHLCTPKSNDVSTTYTFEAIGHDYDLAFGEVVSNNDFCDLKQMDVNIDECASCDLEVKVLRVYINYVESGSGIQIDEDMTKTSLNNNLQTLFEGENGGDIVEIYESVQRITIEAKLKEGEEAPTLDELHNIITIYFTGGSSVLTRFNFTYFYPNKESRMLLQNGTDCFMSYPNLESDNKTREYTFPASMVKNYDLEFGQVDYYLQDPDVTCKSNMVPIDVVDIDNPQWEIKSIKVYIKYDEDLVIDDEHTDLSLQQQIKNNYDYTFSSTNRMLSFEASIKSGADKITFDEIDDEHLFTMFFSGNPGETVNIEFSYDTPASLMNANEEGNEDDCITVYPKQNTSPINYTFDGDYLSGIISTYSNLEMKGRCNGPNGSNVDVMEDVTLKYYNMDKDPNNPYHTSKTGSDGIFEGYVSKDCTKRIVPEKEICNECGFTLQDINKIRRVILGIDDEFDFAYQTFVADMNGNGTVTTLDIVYIARMMLVKELNLNGYTDFKFIPAKDFIKFQNEGFYGLGVPNYNSYIEFDTPPYFVTFYAFKSGDVVKDDHSSGDLGCDHCNPDCFVPKNPKPIRKEGIKEDNATTGSIHEIDLNIEESEDYFYITGSTLSKDSFSLIGAAINIEPAGLEIDTVLFYDLEDEMPGYNYEKETGIIKLLWTNKNSYTSNLSTSDNLFKIILKKGKYNKTDLNFSLVENNKLNYCIKNNSETYKTVLGEKIEQRSDNITQEFSIYPTLFDDKIYIDYYSSHTTQANLQLYDLQGRILLQKEFEALKGSNTRIVKSLQNIPAGVVFYKAEINGDIYTGKIIKSEKSTNPYSE